MSAVFKKVESLKSNETDIPLARKEIKAEQPDHAFVKSTTLDKSKAGKTDIE